MTTTNLVRGRTLDLPSPLQAAQEAIHFPEVQEMLRRLSEYKLGIFMPHAHKEYTGEFQPLPDDMVQVESGLMISFHRLEEIASQPKAFLPVGWVWRAGAPTVASACEMVKEEGPGDPQPTVKHKMPGQD